jgi:hypothetical protein
MNEQRRQELMEWHLTEMQKLVQESEFKDQYTLYNKGLGQFPRFDLVFESMLVKIGVKKVGDIEYFKMLRNKGD